MRAQDLFYRALSTRDLELAQALWSDGVDFLCQAYQTDANAPVIPPSIRPEKAG